MGSPRRHRLVPLVSPPEDLTRHPFSQVWPDLDPWTAIELDASVKEWGVVEPITIFMGQVLDGWSRYSAAVGLDETHGLRFQELQGDIEDAYEYVVAKNALRRSLTPRERAQCIAVMAREVGKYPTNSARAFEIAKRAKVSMKLAAEVSREVFSTAPNEIEYEAEPKEVSPAQEKTGHATASPNRSWRPSPEDRKRFRINISKSMYLIVRDRAREMGMSITEYFVRVMAQAVGAESDYYASRFSTDALTECRKENAAKDRKIKDLEAVVKAVEDDAQPGLAVRVRELVKAQHELKEASRGAMEWQRRYQEEQKRSAYYLRLLREAGIDPNAPGS